MKELKVTDREYGILARAVEVQQDIMNDTILENIGAIDLYAKEPICVTPEQLKAFRDELDSAINDVLAARTLMIKLGMQPPEVG